MSNIIYASFNDPQAAERAVGALLDHGVRKEDVSVVSSHDGIAEIRDAEDVQANVGMAYEPIFGYNAALGAVAIPPVYTDIPARSTPAGQLDSDSPTYRQRSEFGETSNDNTVGDHYPNVITETANDTEEIAKSGVTTTTSKDAEEGAIKGSLWGAGVGIIAGLAALVVPGVGLVYGGGALALALIGAAGTTAAGAAAGAVTGFLVDQGVDSDVAVVYEQTLNSGGALIAVTVPSGAVSSENAQLLLQKYGSITINSSTPKGYFL